MAATSSRNRAGTRRSPKAAPPPAPLRPVEPQRPQLAPFAAAFGVLVAAEGIYLAYLLWEPDPGWHWYVAAPVVLAALAVLGAAMVWLGRARGWLVLTAASVVPLLLLLGLVVLFGVLGGGRAVVWGLLLLVGPVGCLALTLSRPVREWTRPRLATRTAGGARGSARAR
jgi:hypothetical protein